MAFIVSTFLFSPFKVVDTSNTIEAFHIGDTSMRNIISWFFVFHLLGFLNEPFTITLIKITRRPSHNLIHYLSKAFNYSLSISPGMSKWMDNNFQINTFIIGMLFINLSEEFRIILIISTSRMRSTLFRNSVSRRWV